MATATQKTTVLSAFSIISSLHKKYANGEITKEEFMVKTAPILAKMRELEASQTQAAA